jgi:hypothetical protein
MQVQTARLDILRNYALTTPSMWGRRLNIERWFNGSLSEMRAMYNGTKPQLAGPTACACLIGHATFIPEFRAAGLSLASVDLYGDIYEPQNDADFYRLYPIYQDQAGVFAVSRFFGLDREVAQRLSLSTYYNAITGWRAAAGAVIKINNIKARAKAMETICL